MTVTLTPAWSIAMTVTLTPAWSIAGAMTLGFGLAAMGVVGD
jgi:hypothetical protein